MISTTVLYILCVFVEYIIQVQEKWQTNNSGETLICMLHCSVLHTVHVYQCYWYTAQDRITSRIEYNAQCGPLMQMGRATPRILVTGFQTFAKCKFKSRGCGGKIFQKIV